MSFLVRFVKNHKLLVVNTLANGTFLAAGDFVVQVMQNHYNRKDWEEKRGGEGGGERHLWMGEEDRVGRRMDGVDGRVRGMDGMNKRVGGMDGMDGRVVGMDGRIVAGIEDRKSGIDFGSGGMRGRGGEVGKSGIDNSNNNINNINNNNNNNKSKIILSFDSKPNLFDIDWKRSG